MDMDEMKQQWDSLKIKMTPAELVKRTTSLEVLTRNYRRFAILACACIFGAFSFFQLISRGEIRTSPAIMALFIAAMAISACVDFYLYSRLKEIDPQTMSVSEVAERARACRRVHLISQLVLLPIVIAFIGIVAYASTSSALRWGLVCGAVFGAVIGFSKWLEIMRTYRSLT